MPDKATLRTRMRGKRSALPEAEAAALSLAAQRHILALPAWEEAHSVGLYMAVRRETDTGLLLDAAWREGKEVLLPHTSPHTPGVMQFYPCLGRQSLVVSRFGIPEPDPAACPSQPEGGWTPGLVIVPGLAFDREGHRLGSGGGYYDRIFARDSMQDVLRIGLAYGFQVLASLPAEIWDAPMHALATEEGILWL